MFETFYLKNVGGNAIRIFYGIWQAEYEIPLEGKKCKIDLKVLKQLFRGICFIRYQNII